MSRISEIPEKCADTPVHLSEKPSQNLTQPKVKISTYYYYHPCYVSLYFKT